ncbi:methyltransferase domain-containing protein [Segnochrobactraceae bacterium EtOH-i3]
MSAPTGSAPPILFDRALLARRRAGRPGDDRGAVSLVTAVAEDLADRREAVLRVFDRILVLGDTGGSLSARLAIAGPGARLVRAASLATGPDDAGAEVIVDEEALPFAPAAFDLVASNLVLSGVNDLPGALIQLRRTLAPDGLLLASLIGGDTLTELRQALAEAETALSGGLSPRVAPFPDVRAAASLLQRAGFALPVADVERYTVRYDDLFALARDLRALGATNALAERRRRPDSRALFLKAAEIYADRFSDPDGRVRATLEVIHLSGWVPHESQQKPLAPGSAKARLKDALS